MVGCTIRCEDCSYFRFCNASIVTNSTATCNIYYDNNYYPNSVDYDPPVIVKEKVPLIKICKKVAIKEIHAERSFQHRYNRGGRRR